MALTRVKNQLWWLPLPPLRFIGGAEGMQLRVSHCCYDQACAHAQAQEHVMVRTAESQVAQRGRPYSKLALPGQRRSRSFKGSRAGAHL